IHDSISCSVSLLLCSCTSRTSFDMRDVSTRKRSVATMLHLTFCTRIHDSISCSVSYCCAAVPLGPSFDREFHPNTLSCHNATSDLLYKDSRLHLMFGFLTAVQLYL
ncbi:hypothetical protein J6590_030131, partial [Homalodisca vitripennis]